MDGISYLIACLKAGIKTPLTDAYREAVLQRTRAASLEAALRKSKGKRSILGGRMYLSSVTIENFRCFGEGPHRLELPLRRGLTALVGENEAGKTAVIDALRFVLGTTDQEWFRLEDSDFHGGTNVLRDPDCLQVRGPEPKRQASLCGVSDLRRDARRRAGPLC